MVETICNSELIKQREIVPFKKALDGRKQPVRKKLGIAARISFCVFLTLATDSHAQVTDPASAADHSVPLYVDAQAIKDRFSSVTSADMDMLRSKKILFMSRSFGLNTVQGLSLLAKQDKKYDLLSSYKRFGFGGKTDDPLPANVFTQYNFIHCGAPGWPMSQRLDDLDKLMRQGPYNFGKTIDAAFLFYEDAAPNNFDYYAKKLDALQADFPNVKVIYACSGFHGPKMADRNESAQAFSEKVRARYKGIDPLFDMGKILSDDFRVGHVFCPEYSKDPAGVHPDLPEGEMILAKGFILTLLEAFHAPSLPVSQLPPLQTTEANAHVETLSADSPDYKAVLAILEANGMDKHVENYAVVENGRVVKLILNEFGVTTLPSSIGALTELKVLDVFGDRKRAYPFLKSIDPAIGNCTKLEELLLNQNDLVTLPAEITKLQKLRTLSIADNHLKDLPPEGQAWAQKFDPKGLAMQNAADPAANP